MFKSRCGTRKVSEPGKSRRQSNYSSLAILTSRDQSRKELINSHYMFVYWPQTCVHQCKDYVNEMKKVRVF